MTPAKENPGWLSWKSRHATTRPLSPCRNYSPRCALSPRRIVRAGSPASPVCGCAASWTCGKRLTPTLLTRTGLVSDRDHGRGVQRVPPSSLMSEVRGMDLWWLMRQRQRNERFRQT